MFLQGAAIWHPRCGPGPDESMTTSVNINGSGFHHHHHGNGKKLSIFYNKSYQKNMLKILFKLEIFYDLKPFNFYRTSTERAITIQDSLDFRSKLKYNTCPQ